MKVAGEEVILLLTNDELYVKHKSLVAQDLELILKGDFLCSGTERIESFKALFLYDEDIGLGLE